jgi:hypothetical protein
MSLTDDERRYLRAFEAETHKSGSDGYLACNRAAKESDVNDEGGKLALRLQARGYLEQRRKGFPDFRITSEGIRALLPWWRRELAVVVTIILAIIGWALAVLQWAVR